MERLENSRLEPIGRVPRDPQRDCEAIGGLEADAPHLERERVRISGHDVDRTAAKALPDAMGQRRGHVTPLEEDHDVSEGALLAPCLRHGDGALGPEAFHLAEPLRLLVEHA